MNGSLFDFFAFRMILFADLTAFSTFPFDCAWPGLKVLCLKSPYGLKQPKETLKSHDVPTRPWVKIGTDLFCFSGNDYLITVDYYSSFFEIDRLYDTSSKTAISKLKQHLRFINCCTGL
jgi:hypothetical protein